MLVRLTGLFMWQTKLEGSPEDTLRTIGICSGDTLWIMPGSTQVHDAALPAAEVVLQDQPASLLSQPADQRADQPADMQTNTGAPSVHSELFDQDAALQQEHADALQMAEIFQVFQPSLHFTVAILCCQATAGESVAG